MTLNFLFRSIVSNILDKYRFLLPNLLEILHGYVICLLTQLIIGFYLFLNYQKENLIFELYYSYLVSPKSH